jgi:RNA polymerase sigma-70 factor (ECF subfamily)
MDGEVDIYSQLLSEIALGNQTAESELINRFWRGLVFVLNRQCKDHCLAEDLAQDALIIVIQKARAGQIQNARGLSSFVRQTGINLLVNQKRKEIRHKTDTNDCIDHLFPSNASSSLQQIENEQVKKIVIEVIQELGQQRDRDIIIQTFVHDQPKDVVCENLNLSKDHFDKVLFRARERLKQKLMHNLKISPSHLGKIMSLLIGLFIAVDTPSLIKEEYNAVRESPSSYHLSIMTSLNQ